MFKHIVVPIDLSARNERALDIVLTTAVQNQARVTLLHVVQRIDHIAPNEMQEFYDRLRQLAEKRLARAAQRFIAKGVETARIVTVGEPARDIVKYAQAKRADLIVINSHRVLDLSRPGRDLGTVSYKVAILCRCPVLLVK